MKMNNQSKRLYQISRLDNAGEGWQSNLVPADVNVFPWPASADKDYRPVTAVKAAVYDNSLLVFMETDETEIRAEEKDFSNKVHTDSCMEFFLMPSPYNSAQYINWEINPVGALNLSIGTHRYDRHPINIENYRKLFNVRTNIHNAGWNLEYRIPLSFLRRIFPILELRSGHSMRGNFYKCGDKTARPHYACWSPIELAEPDFHCPYFFGDLVLA